jgi:hypothetical protein
MKPFFAAAFLFFSMAMSVNDHEDKNNQAASQQHNEDRPVLPKLGNQVAKVWGNICNHPDTIYIHAS